MSNLASETVQEDVSPKRWVRAVCLAFLGSLPHQCYHYPLKSPMDPCSFIRREIWDRSRRPPVLDYRTSTALAKKRRLSAMYVRKLGIDSDCI
jgi:hypothetical protein